MGSSYKIDSILKLKVVCQRTGRGKTAIYKDIKLGRFPPPIDLGGRSKGWLESEVMAWIQSRIDATRNPDIKQKNKG